MSAAAAEAAEAGAEYDCGNVFSKIIDGTIPSYKVFETEDCLAILDAFPVVKGHSLLIPKAKGYTDVISMPGELLAKTLANLPRLCRIVKEATGADGVNVIQNNRSAAG